MKKPAQAITLSRSAFIQEMRKDNFARYTLYKNGKKFHLVAAHENGTEFIFGTAYFQPRFWSDLNNPIKFLEDSGVMKFDVQIEGESA